MFTNPADDISTRVLRLTGAEIAERIIMTDLTALRDRAELRRTRATAKRTVADEALLCAMVCGRVGAGDE